MLDWVDGVNLAQRAHQRRSPGPSGVERVAVGRTGRRSADGLASARRRTRRRQAGQPDPRPHGSGRGRRPRLVLGPDLVEAARGGTPGFPAPEIAGGASRPAPATSSAWRATVFALLTGEPPTGRHAQVERHSPRRRQPFGGGAARRARRSIRHAGLQRRANWSSDSAPAGATKLLRGSGPCCSPMSSARRELWNRAATSARVARGDAAGDRPSRRSARRSTVGATVEGDASGLCVPERRQRSAGGDSDATQRSRRLRECACGPASQPAKSSRSTARSWVDGEPRPRGSAISAGPARSCSRDRPRQCSASRCPLASSSSSSDRTSCAASKGSTTRGSGCRRCRSAARSVSQPVSRSRAVRRRRMRICSSVARMRSARCLELLRANGFVAVIGTSGSGKTSLALAGLAPTAYRKRSWRPGAHPWDRSGRAASRHTRTRC